MVQATALGMETTLAPAHLAKGLVEKAKRTALIRSTGLEARNAISPVCMRDFLEVLETFEPSVSEQDLLKWYSDGLGSIS